VGDHPVVPEYGGACVCNVVPALLEPGDDTPPWLPEGLVEARQVVLVLLDGLGWEQLEDRWAAAPTFRSMSGGPILTVAPSTTATALTSISTGLPPGEHGVVGYRMAMDGNDVLNVLRWSIPGRDARAAHPPPKTQVNAAFAGHRPAVVTRAEFHHSGFTQAHLEGVRFTGYRTTSTMMTEIRRALRDGEPFVYAYYDGIDKVAHEYGLAEHYESELSFVDDLVAQVMEALPPGGAVVVISDHGQVDVGANTIDLPGDLIRHVDLQSGEGRFRWLHAKPGHQQPLYEVASDLYRDVGWVVTRDETIDERWFGPEISDAALSRLGDVALVARDPVAWMAVDDTGPYELIARHGSLTSAEMHVPLLAYCR
jgi:predicted AlkP superfamily pyrophosphatase or phosphodiesterase